MALVNQLMDHHDGRYFGGALVVSKSGDILAEYPIHKEGMLITDLTDAGLIHAHDLNYVNPDYGDKPLESP